MIERLLLLRRTSRKHHILINDYENCGDLDLIQFHEQVLRISQEIGDRTIEAKAFADLDHASRCMGHLIQAKRWHERQLDIALAMKDKLGEGRACSNLEIVYQLLGK